jgi:RNA polymerase sigma-70 factor, ECF subfamily
MTRFEQQVVDMLPRLRRYARALCSNGDEAEDLLQDCVEKAFARRVTWRGDNIQAWLMTMLTNLNRNRIRQTRAAPAHLHDHEPDEIAAPQGEEDPLERGRLTAALDRLHPDQRAVLMLVVVEGYRYAEVSRMLDIPIGTVMSRLSRARRTLASILESDNIIEFRRNR